MSGRADRDGAGVGQQRDLLGRAVLRQRRRLPLQRPGKPGAGRRHGRRLRGGGARGRTAGPRARAAPGAVRGAAGLDRGRAAASAAAGDGARALGRGAGRLGRVRDHLPGRRELPDRRPPWRRDALGDRQVQPDLDARHRAAAVAAAAVWAADPAASFASRPRPAPPPCWRRGACRRTRPRTTQEAGAAGGGRRSTAALLRAASWLLPFSYVVSATLAPILPHRLAAVGVGASASFVAAIWMATRFGALRSMWRSSFWHGRWETLAARRRAGGRPGARPPGAHRCRSWSPASWLYGAGMGLIYYASLYYSMAIGHGGGRRRRQLRGADRRRLLRRPAAGI